MKKILIFLLAVVFIIISVITVSAESHFDIQVKRNGEGAVSYFSDNKTVTFACVETAEPFVFWNIQGKYNIVKGDYNDKSFTVKPLSDITAIAVFESGVKNKVATKDVALDTVSPKTGVDRFYAIAFAFDLGAALMLACSVLCERGNK